MQRKFLLPMLAVMMLAGANCFASKIIYNSGVRGGSAAFNFPASCIGHQATIWAIGFKQGEDITVSLTFKNPSGQTLATATSHYNNDYENNTKTEQAILNFTFTVVSGSYTITLGGWSEQEVIAQISNVLVICWGCPGEDVTTVRNELTTEITGLRSELEGALNTKTAELQSKIDSLKTRLNEAVTRHETDQTALLKQIQDLKNEINTLGADLLFNIARVERAQAEYLAQLEVLKITHQKDLELLNLRINNLDSKYDREVEDIKNDIEKINEELIFMDRDSSDKISDLREKQADYYARMEILKVTHEKDKEAIEKEIADLDAKYKTEVEAINAKIASVKEEISKLEAKHNADVANLQSQIDATVNKLDDEVRKIYLELTAVKDELAAHQKATQLAIDNLQLQITELDKSVTERLQNLENRIKYAVYSDEKLAALQKDFTAQIQAKEKEIADLDLEIQDMTNAGLDTSAKEATRTRLLKELLKLRNELTDIEFAIEIRHNESEFAEHEKEIALLKGELAALRNSTDLQIKQLKDELLATEAKYLKLLEDAKLDAANQTAAVQKQLDDLTAKVLAFVDALRSERESGDTELKALIEAMDVSHKELIANLDKTIADKLEKMKFETDTQFENLRSTINNIAYQQRFSTGGSATSYSLPNGQIQDVPADSRDLRVSPDAALDSTLN